ncbi:MAG: hypothetical protein WCR54_05305 [Clostridia bacterium]
MRCKKTILILSGKYNKEVGESIKEVFNQNKTCLAIDVNHRELENGFKSKFLDVIFPLDSTFRRKWRKLYRKILAMFHDRNKKLNLKKTKLLGINRKTKNALNRYNPDILVVTSTPLLTPAILAVQRSEIPVKLCVVGDSFVIHQKMINNNVDYYFVDNYDLRTKLVENNIVEEKIFIAPLPLTQKAFEEISVEDAYKKLALNDDKKTILINTGSDGDDCFIEVVNQIAKATLQANIIVACGKNTALMTIVKNNGFFAYNDTINMEMAISASDLIISCSDNKVIAQSLLKQKLVFGIFPNGKKEELELDYLSTDSIVRITDTQDLIEKTVNYLTDIEAGNSTDYDSILELLRDKENENGAKIICNKLMEIIENTGAEKEAAVVVEEE